METEDNLSDASLIEDDEEEDEIIDFPEEVPETLVMDQPEPELSEDPQEQEHHEDPEFHGFTDADLQDKPEVANVSSDEDFDVKQPFLDDMTNCSGYYAGIKPPYVVRFAESPLATNDESMVKKVKPLKIKKPATISTPSPMLQRESREWKPSSQFFKPLSAGWVREVIYERNEDGTLSGKAKEVVYHAPLQAGSKSRTFKSPAELRPYLGGYPTLTMHNFSFRADPLNAPKGQEIIRGIDEQVEIFPKKAEVPLEMQAPGKKETPTSLNPAFQSGTLKVKLFGKMKEKNTFENPDQNSRGDAATNNSELMEIEDDEEDFELENSPVQSLGNSGVTITPISALNKKRNIHTPTSGSGLELKKMKMSGGATLSKKQPRPILGPANTAQPFTLGNSSTTITSALESYAGNNSSAAKSMPSVTLTPTGNMGTKKRMNIKNTPLRPIEAQSVVNIAGMKYLVVPHPDPDALKRKKESKDDHKLPIILKTNNEDMPSFEVEENSQGKLIIVPLGPKSENARKLLRKPQNKLDLTQFNSTLSGGYFALLHVFKYLKTKERLVASKVCKLWHQISQHPSLWKNLSLKSCRVKDWKCLRDQINRHGTQKIDMRKIIINSSTDEFWTDFATKLVSASTTLTSLELPKIAPKHLYAIAQSAHNSPITNITAINAYSVSCQDEALDLLQIVSNLENLQELKLKAASGGLSIDNFSTNLPEFVNLSSQNKLNKLAMLSLKTLNLEDLQMLCQLKNLTDLELGNCDLIEPEDLFSTLAQLPNLRYLRLEKGRFDRYIGQLAHLPQLTELELIEFEMVQGFREGLVNLQNIKKLLLIPTYKDEVAAINAEALDAFLSLTTLTHVYIGLTTEWLDTMNTLMSKEGSSNAKDSFPVLVNGVVEMYTLGKLFKTVSSALPRAQKVKILKMPKSSTKKQYISLQKN